MSISLSRAFSEQASGKTKLLLSRERQVVFNLTWRLGKCVELPPDRPSFPAILVTLVMCGTCVALASTSSGEEPRITAVRLDGAEVSGRLATFDGKGLSFTNEREAGKVSNLPLADLLSVELEGRASSKTALPVLEFANGDRIQAEIAETSDDQLTARWHDSVLAVPLEVLRGVIFRPLDPNEGSTELLLRDRGPNDIVLLSNGDRLAGQFLSLGPSDLKIDVEGREVLAPRDRVAAIFFSPELTVPAIIPGPRQIVHDGTGWLTVEGLNRNKSGTWTGTTAFRQSVSWPAGTVRRVQNFSERVVPLTSIQPEIEFTPYLERQWPVRSGRTVTGEPLSIGDQTYAAGIGVHSRCRLRYNLGRRFETFHAVAGLAASSGKLGSVEFAVELNGREVIRTEPLERSSEPLRVTNLDVSDAGTLTLAVDFGRNGDVLDRANWCDAILVRKLTASE